MRITAADVGFHELAHSFVHGAVIGTVLFIVDAKELLEILFKDLFEVIC
jgi:hypothetical protein